MIYPDNYERKIGFEDVRRMLRGNCRSEERRVGKECSSGWGPDH